MTLRFLLDEDLSQQVAIGLRARGIDAVSVHEIGRDNQRISDEIQLAFAVEQGRVMVTYNRRDFQLLDARWREEGRTHAGILWGLQSVIPRHAIGELIRALVAASEEYDSLDGLCLLLRRAE
jgi:predicted nuclease of predicted toxin-antitoxin system